MSYKHITRDKRVELSALLKAGVPKASIALQLDLHRSTLWREIRRNKGHRQKYDVRVAQANANRRRLHANAKGDKIKNNKKLKNAQLHQYLQFQLHSILEKKRQQ